MRTKIQDVLHLYLGCEAEIISDLGTIRDIITTSTIEHKDAWKVTPILRHISDLTENEDEQWSKLCILTDATNDEAMIKYYAKKINFYRSIGIDCDELIHSGQAIQKIKLKQSQQNVFLIDTKTLNK